MNILLVDDDVDVIEGMLDAIDFAGIGISRAFSAYNITEAKKLLLSVKIDIMVTDIEMPNGSGIDLLSWICDEHLDIITLFCTCYNDFSYVKKALQLRSFDYFLKPIAYSELTDRLMAAVEAATILRNSRNASYNLDKLRKAAIVEYWGITLMENRTNTPLPSEYTGNENVLICLTSLQDSSGTIPSWKKYAFENICDELWSGENGASLQTILRLSDNLMCTVSLVNKNYCPRIILTDIMEHLEKDIQLISNHYIGTSCSFYKAKAVFDKLVTIENDDIASKKQIWDISDYKLKTFSNSSPKLDEWALLLSCGQSEKLLYELFTYIDNLTSSGEFNVSYAKAIRSDISQIIHNALTNHQINAHTIFAIEDFEKLGKKSLRSIDDLKRYLSLIIKISSEHLLTTNTQNSITGRVKEYIGTHLEEELTRTEIAKHMYLNPDYLARIFKEKCGISLGSYILEKRIREAKRFLLETDLTINVIAMRVGYDNFSHFSQLFKKRTGVSPNEFRNSHE